MNNMCLLSYIAKRFASKKGNLLLFVLMFGGFAFTVIVMGVSSYALFESKVSEKKHNRDAALHIAEAGINYYRWHLAHSPSDYQDGTGASGPYEHELTDKDGNVLGSYSLYIIPPEDNSTVVKIYSTGWTVDDPDNKRTIFIRIGYSAITDSAMVMNSDAVFSPTSEVYGKVHSNYRIQFNGIAHDTISSSKYVYGSGGPTEFWEYPVPTKDFNSFTRNMTTFYNNSYTGIHLTSSGADGYHLVFQSDGTFDLYRVTSRLSYSGGLNSMGFPPPHSGSNYSYDIGSETLIAADNPIPDNGIIFVEDYVWVEGVVNGYVTIAAGKPPFSFSLSSTRDIYVNNNLTLNEKNSDDAIGLFTQGWVIFPFNIPTDFTVEAALLSQYRRIGRPPYYNSGPSGATRDSLTIFGSAISPLGVIGKYVSGSYIYSGFINTNYIYDDNLRYVVPPGFPVESTYELISWEEVTSVPYEACEGDNMSITYEGVTYPVIKIGDQCWFAENLRVGTLVSGGSSQNSDNSTIEKWCYQNTEQNCTTYGAWYTWMEAMQLPSSCQNSNTGSCAVTGNHQGICPSGWHIPSDTEFQTLEQELGMCSGTSSGCSGATGYRGTDQGTKLMAGGASGFNAPRSGYTYNSTNFYWVGSAFYMWTATQPYSNQSWYRYVLEPYGYGNQIYRTRGYKYYGYSVRCLKD